jgi:hypothetical protein
MLVRFSADTHSIPAQVVYFQLKNLEGSTQSALSMHTSQAYLLELGKTSSPAAFLEASPEVQLQWKADAAKQVGKAGVAPEWVKDGPIFERSHERGSLCAGFFQPLKGFVLVAKSRMDERDGAGTHLFAF